MFNPRPFYLFIFSIQFQSSSSPALVWFLPTFSPDFTWIPSIFNLFVSSSCPVLVHFQFRLNSSSVQIFQSSFSPCLVQLQSSFSPVLVSFKSRSCPVFSPGLHQFYSRSSPVLIQIYSSFSPGLVKLKYMFQSRFSTVHVSKSKAFFKR